MIPIIRYTLLTALRDRLFIGLFIAVFCAVAIAFFLGSTALTEQNQMTLAYAAGAARMTVIVGLVLFICFHVRRSFENKEIELILSRPISRPVFVLSYWAGFAVLTVLLALPVILIIWMFTHPDMIGLLYWGGSLVLEGMLISAFALVASLIVQSAVVSVLASGGFYLLSRMMGFFMLLVAKPIALPTEAGTEGSIIMGWLIKAIAITLPRLDLYGKTAWLLYGIGDVQDSWVFGVQSLVYIPLLLGMAMWDFRRKQF